MAACSRQGTMVIGKRRSLKGGPIGERVAAESPELPGHRKKGQNVKKKKKRHTPNWRTEKKSEQTCRRFSAEKRARPRLKINKGNEATKKEATAC